MSISRKIVGAMFLWRVAAGCALPMALIATPSFAAAAIGKLQSQHRFSIPAQNLDTALLAFSEQAHIQILMWGGMSDIRSPGAVGEQRALDALHALLQNTGLTFQQIDQSTVAIRPMGAGTTFGAASADSAVAPASVLALSTSTRPAARLFRFNRAEERTAGDAAESQPSSGSSAVLEQVVVTARKREEKLQDVPDSIVAIPAEVIERANISAARDVTARIPNVSIVESLSPSSTFIIVRGIASTRNSEPAVAVVVDGVQVGSATEVSQSFYDVEQIELLKGPQGALYGRNAIGGALIITSKKPTEELAGRVTAGTGDNGWNEVSGAVSGPIADHLFLRVAGNHKSFDGTIENEFLTRTQNAAQANSTGRVPNHSYMDFEESNDFRVQGLWEPTEKSSFDLRYARNDLESGAMWYRNIFRLESDPNVAYEFPINSNGNPTAFRTIDSASLKMDFSIVPGTLTSVSNYTDTSERYGVAGEVRGNDRTGNVLFFTEPFVDEFLAGLSDPADIAFFNAQLGSWRDGNFVGSDQYYDIQTFSQEVRLVSGTDRRLRYVTGAYLLLTDRADTIRATWELPTGSAFDCGPSNPTDFATCSGLFNSTQNEQDNTAWALFASTDFDLTDTLTLTAAGRYDEDSREVTRIDGPTVDTFGRGIGSCDSAADPENCNPTGTKIDQTFSAFQPKLSLAWKPRNDLTLYGTYARGFRSGGFNASGALLTDSYDKEILDSYEIGLKSTALDNRLRMSSAVFFEDYENAQQFEFDGNVFVQSLYNIPKSEIYGLEANIELAVSQNLLLTVGLGWMDSEIVEFDPQIFARLQSELLARTANTVKLPAGTAQAFARQFKGERLPLFAHKTANIGLEYKNSLPFLDGRSFTTRMDYSYFGDRYWWIDGQDVQEQVSLLEANVSMEIIDNLELALWCKNCTDEVYDSEYGPQEKELFGGAAKDVAYRARLRTYGLRATYKF